MSIPKLPLYLLPPEAWQCAAGGEVSTSTDVWSFGIVLWEMFSGGWNAVRYMQDIQQRQSNRDSFSGII